MQVIQVIKVIHGRQVIKVMHIIYVVIGYVSEAKHADKMARVMEVLFRQQICLFRSSRSYRS